MIETTLQIKGLKELFDTLQLLPTQIEKKLVRGGLFAGTKVFKAAAKDNLVKNGSIYTGELQKSVRISLMKKSEKYGYVRYRLVAGNKKAWYSHFVEYGTASYYTGKGKSVGGPYVIKAKKKDSLFFAGSFVKQVTHPGSKPVPFMRPALDENQGKAIEAMAEYIRKKLPKEISKANT